jgi:hypothetical protein
MTGRELILYILQNHLEDEPVVKNGRPLGLLTVPEMAAKLGVGASTIGAWVALDMMRVVRIGNTDFIPDIYDYECESELGASVQVWKLRVKGVQNNG